MDQIPASKPDPEMNCAETETLHLVDTLIGELPSKSRLCRAKNHLKQMAKRALVAPIRGARPLPFFHRQANFKDLGAKTAEVWSRERAL